MTCEPITITLDDKQSRQLNTILDSCKIDQQTFINYNLHKQTVPISIVDQQGLKLRMIAKKAHSSLAGGLN